MNGCIPSCAFCKRGVRVRGNASNNDLLLSSRVEQKKKNPRFGGFDGLKGLERTPCVIYLIVVPY